MNPSLEYLERCAAETGFQIIPLEKVVRLGEVAADVSRHPLLGEALALKGGTALNLCFGPPQRLSVDLDFNYIAHLERERMLADRPRVERAAADPGVAALVITGAGSAFCAGGDLAAMRERDPTKGCIGPLDSPLATRNNYRAGI